MLPTNRISKQGEVKQQMPDLSPFLAQIAENTAATAEAINNMQPAQMQPAPTIELLPAPVTIDVPQPVIEWHFEVKRNSLNLITDVVARGMQRG